MIEKRREGGECPISDAEPPEGPWITAIQNASRLLWVKRLAAETAMKRLGAKLDAVNAQFPLEGEAEKSQQKINDKARETVKEKISRAIKGEWCGAIAATNLFFVCIYRLQ